MLDSAAEGAQVRIWTVGMALAASRAVGPLQAGWSKLPLPADFARGLANGAYYVTVSVHRGLAHADSRPGKIMLLR